MAFLGSFDIVVLLETWSKFTGEFDALLTGFEHFDNVRQMNQNNIRNSGGVSVFVNRKLFDLKIIHRIYYHFKDCVVLLCNFSHIGHCNDVVMYFTYVSPEHSPIYKHVLEQNGIITMQSNIDEILSVYPQCSIIIAGDLNARTKDFLDYIPNDNITYIFGDVDYNMSEFNMPRKNIDCNRFNNFGRTLTQFCSTHDMHILNGRLFEDSEGHYTCYTQAGNSVVDYFIASANFFENITKFSVLNNDESDHLPLRCDFSFTKRNYPAELIQDDTKINALPKYKWNDDMKIDFISSIRNSCELSKEVILNEIDRNVNTAVQTLTTIYQQSAHCMRSKIKFSYNKCDPEWWDEQCEVLKSSKYIALRKYRNTHYENDLALYKAKKNDFKAKCRINKLKLQKSKREKLIKAKKNPKDMWKLIKQSNKKAVSDDRVQNKDWVAHFSSLLYDRNKCNDLTPHQIIDDESPLNLDITASEIQCAIKKLTLNKAGGIDGITGEFYRCTTHEILPFLLPLFNAIFKGNQFPESWRVSVITPIHKSGSKSEPENYRGISVTPVMYKIFARVINERLYNWAEEHNKINESQSGFRRNYSTTDNLFSLNAIIQKYLSRKCGRFYCLYVDFKKAFDTLNHKKIFEMLRRIGVNGHMLNTLQLMYTDLKSCIKTKDGVTDFFACNVGTRQGDITSTTIFSLFINELDILLRQECESGIFINNDIPDIICLMYADDVANCAETIFKLQQQLNTIDKFCTNSGMDINLKKTEVIVFRNGGPLKLSENWYYRGQKVNITNVYKYMGLLFTPTLSWTQAQHKLAAQAQKAIFTILNYQRSFGQFMADDLFCLFDSMVKPILCYGSSIWGHTYSDEIEKVQVNFCKKYLNVKSSTNDCIVLGECGRLPLCCTYYIDCIRYWCKLLTMQNHRYPKNCYKMLKSLDDVGRRSWASNVKHLLYTYGFGYVWISQEVGDSKMFLSVFKQRLIDVKKQDWHRSINESNRCHHYKHFKSLLNVELYLNLDISKQLKISIARFRCSSHRFRVETGRHMNEPRNLRICLYCNENLNINIVECEYHIFFECKRFLDIRNSYLYNWYTGHVSIQNFYKLLSLNDRKTIHKTALFIHKLLNN